MPGMTQICVALIFHIMDLVTGLIGAIRQGKVQSSKMRDGMFKKVGFMCCYALALLIDQNAGSIGLPISGKVLPVIIVYAVTTEIVSIIENIGKINPDLVPARIMSLFQLDKESGVKHDAKNP